jgi:hypothetical protein
MSLSLLRWGSSTSALTIFNGLIFIGHRSENKAIKDSQGASAGTPTKKAEAHAKLIDDALKENDYFIDHKDVKK